MQESKNCRYLFADGSGDSNSMSFEDTRVLQEAILCSSFYCKRIWIRKFNM